MLEKISYYPFLNVVCNCLFKGAWSSSIAVAIAIVGEIQKIILDWLLFKDLNVFVVGWHVPKRNLNAKQMWLLIINNKWIL